MTHITDDMIQRGKEELQVKPVAWRYEYRDYPRKKHWAEYVSLTQVQEGAANRECIRNVRPLYASPLPTASGVEVKPKDVDAIRAHAARLLDRMGKTPHGPKRKLLASQHVDLINEALRAEGWNAALLSSPIPTVEVTEEMVERAAKAAFEEGSVVSWETAAELAETDPASAYGSVMGSFRRTARTALTAALSQNKATHRHKKRGTEYVLIGIGKMQSEKWYPVDMREVAIYRSATDPTEIWVRPREEFEDGRFEALSQNDAEDLRAFRASKRPRR
jgi:hypothetical protein